MNAAFEKLIEEQRRKISEDTQKRVQKYLDKAELPDGTFDERRLIQVLLARMAVMEQLMVSLGLMEDK